MSDSGGEDDAASAASGAPPPVAPHQVSADHLRSTHPLWQRAAGKGGGGGSASVGKGRGKAAQAGGDGGGATRYEPLSALALEIDCFRANADGDSALLSSEGGSMAAPPRKRRVEPAHADLFGEEDEEDHEDGPRPLGGLRRCLTHRKKTIKGQVDRGVGRRRDVRPSGVRHRLRWRRLGRRLGLAGVGHRVGA